MILRVSLFVIAAACLAACASLSDRECRAADWYSIGQADGANGRLANYITQHARACNDVGVAPVRSEWLRGREAGLAVYCTPEKAYREGRAGRQLSPACSAAAAAAMSRPHFVGFRYYELSREISVAEAELQSVETDIIKLKPGDHKLRSLLNWKRASLRDRIDDLRLERLRYARWP